MERQEQQLQQATSQQQHMHQQLTQQRQQIQQFAAQMGDITTQCRTAVAEKEAQLSNAQREIERSQAETRDALGKAASEASSARALQAHVDHSQQELRAMKERIARETEEHCASREESVRMTALRIETKNAVTMELMEAKAQSAHNVEVTGLRQEVAEERAKRQASTAGDSPQPCPQCPVRQGIIDQLRHDKAILDETVRQERLAKLAATEAQSQAESALREERSRASAAASAAAEQETTSQKRIAQLESQLNEESLLRIHVERERDEARRGHRAADDDRVRKLQDKHEEYRKSIADLNADHDRRIADQQREYEQRMARKDAQHVSDRDKLIERLNAAEAENEELKARPSGSPRDVPLELAILRKDLDHARATEAHMKAMEAELRRQIALLSHKPVGLSSTHSHRSASRYSASADDEYDEEEEEEEEQEYEGYWDPEGEWEAEGGERQPRQSPAWP